MFRTNYRLRKVIFRRCRLTNLYDVARGKIMEANINSSKEIVERLAGVLSSIREAWRIVEQKDAEPEGSKASPSSPHPAPASISSTLQDEERRQLQRSA